MHPPSVRRPLSRPTLVSRPGSPTKEEVQEQIAAAKLRLSQTATSAATKSAEAASDMDRLLRNQVEILRRLGAIESMLSKLTRSQSVEAAEATEIVDDLPSEASPEEQVDEAAEAPAADDADEGAAS